MTVVSSSAIVEIRAELLSMVAKADGKVMDIENLTAETILENSGSIHEVFAKDLYNWSVKTTLETDEQENLYSQLKNLPVAEKVSIVSSLWAVAASDGEIHPKERSTIKELMELMDVDPNLINASYT